ncbi:BlaI/MecI/CopY family transcriptional regulator [Massilia eurypsychrophila]|jgi:predicted transcriptional regulator|uniref:BlaI/MecI/CopY family transcriptional regulator n=1 Tax=Massilia eurypsychrophila TaxID=1485217 RepID=A0A2G8TA05_9BURK|nr:BlaI/MecI/CopY family transcriptional regulator [Massilia eurypsychrophila]PIL42528.1 BlaI/MecI/CopY family transcriptional regulator [Massilia eurypsychrophila]
MTNRPAPPKPTASELEMLRLLWQLGPATAKQVHQGAVASRPDMAYATVLRLLQVMHTKGLLTRDERERAHIYAPAQPQDSLQTGLIKDLIHKAFSGSGKDLVLAALRGHVTDKEREEIQAILDRDK